MLGFLKRLLRLPHEVVLYLWAAPPVADRAALMLAEEEHLLLDARLACLRESSMVAYHQSRAELLRGLIKPAAQPTTIHQIKP